LSFNTNKKGFTLVEVVVVVAIVVLLPMVVIANFPRIKLQFALSRASYTFAQDLRKAQDRSLSSVEYKDSFGVIQAVDGYGIHIDMAVLGNKKYIIYADKQPGNSQYDSPYPSSIDYSFEVIDFSLSEPGVIIKEINNSFGNKTSINFNPPNSDTTITTQINPSATNVEIVFALESDPSETRVISVNKSGLVQVE